MGTSDNGCTSMPKLPFCTMGQAAADSREDIMTKLYDLIYSDPPWRYTPAEKTRRVENHYPTMPIEDICAMKVPAAKDCILFLWGTMSKLPDALAALDAWGFTYKTGAVWDKKIIGMGYYFRGQHELLLLGTKGTPGAPSPKNRYSSVISVKRGEHSAKPKIVYTMIESMYPDATKLEMFARDRREGWDAFGNDVPDTMQRLLVV